MCFYKKFIRLPSFQITTDNWTEGNCQLSAHPEPELNLDVQIEPFRGIMPEIKCRYFKFILFIYLNNKLLLIVSLNKYSQCFLHMQTNQLLSRILFGKLTSYAIITSDILQVVTRLWEICVCWANNWKWPSSKLNFQQAPFLGCWTIWVGNSGLPEGHKNAATQNCRRHLRLFKFS